MWTDEVEKYLCTVFNSFCDCAKTNEPHKARKVFLSSVNRSFNKKICIDRSLPGSLTILHATTGYSAGIAVPDTVMEAPIEVLDSHWISPFVLP